MKRHERRQSRFMGAYFLCCRTYGRLYRRADGLYRGRCPACGRGATRGAVGEPTGSSTPADRPGARLKQDSVEEL